MKTRGWVILGVSLALLTGAGIWAWDQYKKLMDYCFKFTRYKIQKLGLKQIAVDLTLAVKNKSALAVRITDYAFDVKLNGQFITHISDPVDPATNKPLEQILNAGSISELTLTVDFDPIKTLKAAFSLEVIKGIIFDFESVKFEVSGWIGVNGIKRINVAPIEFTLKDVMPNGQPSPPCE